MVEFGPIVAVLAAQAALHLALADHPIATAGMECVVGAFVETALHESAWDLLDASPGAVGGGVVAAVSALPWALVSGDTAFAVSVASWIAASVVPVLVWLFARPHLGSHGAALAAAAAAFPAPVALHAQLVAGNWHWTQLAFDWAAVVLAQRFVVVPSAGVAAALGFVSALGLYNSPASLPFVALAGLWVVVAGRWTWTTVAAGAAGALPALIWLGSALTHRPLGAVVRTAEKDPILQRLAAMRFDPERLPGLLSPDLPWALHLYDTHPAWDLRWAYGLSRVTVLLSWLGLTLGVGIAVQILARGRHNGAGTAGPWGPQLAWLVPAAFTASFVLAYTLVATRIELRPLPWSEFREESHRALPPLIVDLAIAAVFGFVAAARAAGHKALRVVAYFAAGSPAALGMIGAVALLPGVPAASASPRSDAGLCFDAVAIFAIQRGADEMQVDRACSALSSPSRQLDCALGRAIAIGFEAAVVGPAPGAAAASPRGGPCERVPPDYRARCLGWSRDVGPALGSKTASTCGAMAGDAELGCWIGAGWFASQIAWGRPDWPLPVCEGLGPIGRRGCAMGHGFQLGDHHSAMPWKLRPILEQAPVAVRGDIARGVGFALGRGRTLDRVAPSLCAELGEEQVDVCLEGTAEAARLRGLGVGNSGGPRR